jgi:hypothetical protein
MGDNLDEAVTALTKAIAMAPGRDDLHLLLAQAYIRGSRLAEARSVLFNLERISSDPDTRRRTTSLLDQTEQTTTFTEITADIKPETPVQPPLPPAPAPTNTETVLEALTPIRPAVEGEKAVGLLINLDCANGLTLRVRTDNNTINFHSSEPETIQFLSYTADVTDNIKCGPRNPGTPVSVTYRPVSGGSGIPLVVEFLEIK